MKCFNFVIFCLLLLVVDFGDGITDNWIAYSGEHWDRGWSAGTWNYQDKVAVERSRNALIGGVLVQLYASSTNSSILEVGCGEAAVTDFLTPIQKTRYIGVDISKEAITIAKNKRGEGGMRYVVSAAHHFQPILKFDVIIFSEVLYYTNHEKILQQYAQYLNPDGIIIISIYYMDSKSKFDNIFNYARNLFISIDQMEINGWTRNTGLHKPPKRTSFQLEVLKLHNTSMTMAVNTTI